MTQGQIVWRGTRVRPTYADHWNGLNDEQKMMMGLLGFGWVPNCPVFLGENRDDDDDPEMIVPIAHFPFRLAVYLPSIKPTEESIQDLLDRNWVVAEIGADCLARWSENVHAFKTEFIFGSLPAQKAHSKVKKARKESWMELLQQVV